MGKPKCPACEEGAPAWLVSYGDMSTLLLCFFVFLLVTAKVDVDKLNSATGYMKDKMGLLPNGTDNTSKEKKDDTGVGPDSTLSIDEGKKFILGGKDMFEKGKAEPVFSTDSTRELLDFARQIRGMRNIIEVRGHTSTGEIEGTVYRDDMDLATERARTIRKYLIDSCKIQADRIRIVSCGDHEPLRSNLFVDKEQNRRVEIRITAKYQDFNPNSVIK